MDLRSDSLFMRHQTLGPLVFDLQMVKPRVFLGLNIADQIETLGPIHLTKASSGKKTIIELLALSSISLVLF